MDRQPVDPVSTRRQLTAEFVFFGGSVVLLQASRFVLSLVVARVISVEEFAGLGAFPRRARLFPKFAFRRTERDGS